MLLQYCTVPPWTRLQGKARQTKAGMQRHVSPSPALGLLLLLFLASSAHATDVLVSLFYTGGTTTFEQTYIIPHPGIGVSRSFSTEKSIIDAEFQLHTDAACGGQVLLVTKSSGTLRVEFTGNATVASDTLNIVDSTDTVSLAVRCSLADVSVITTDDASCLNKTTHGWQTFGAYTDRSSFFLVVGLFAATLFSVVLLGTLQFCYAIRGRRVKYLS